MLFRVEVNEILSRVIEVDALNEEEALDTTKADYLQEKFVLDSEDYVTTNFIID